jgi:hypothetical protein
MMAQRLKTIKFSVSVPVLSVKRQVVCLRLKRFVSS